MILTRLFILNFIIGVVISRNFRRHERVCSDAYPRRIYLEFGQEGIVNISFRNISVECSLEILTCPSCIVNFNLSVLTNNKNDSRRNNSCESAIFEISEPPYKESLQKFCNNVSVISTTRNVLVKIIPTREVFGVILKYRSVRNSLQYCGKIGEEGSLKSPFFPLNYPNDLNIEYVITCNTPNCAIKVIFSDFQVSPNSIIEFFDHMGTRLDVATGSQFRPRPLQTQGHALLVRFYAAGGVAAGFHAHFAYVEASENASLPSSDCGGLVEDLGGAITMMDMVQGHSIVNYDCVWIVKALTVYYKSHLFVKVADFTKMEINSKLQIHQGIVSAGRILEVFKVKNDTDDIFNPRELTTLTTTGFYIRLSGSFNSESRIAVSYAAFKYSKENSDCYSVSDFLCENRRCISHILACDGFDQCGDNSEESICRKTDVPGIPIRPSWYLPPHAPNYIFPKYSGGYPDLRTATLVFALSSLGLIALVSVLFILLYRISVKTRNRHGRSDSTRSLQIQVISDALIEEEIIDTESITDEPPTYEAPPIYEDCIIKLENTPKRSIKKPSNSAISVKRGTKRGRRARKASRRKPPFENELGGTPNSPPPKYEPMAPVRKRGRSRSHGEIRNYSHLLCFDTASDSELMNMDQSYSKREKFHTR